MAAKEVIKWQMEFDVGTCKTLYAGGKIPFFYLRGDELATDIQVTQNIYLKMSAQWLL